MRRRPDATRARAAELALQGLDVRDAEKKLRAEGYQVGKSTVARWRGGEGAAKSKPSKPSPARPSRKAPPRAKAARAPKLGASPPPAAAPAPAGIAPKPPEADPLAFLDAKSAPAVPPAPAAPTLPRELRAEVGIDLAPGASGLPVAVLEDLAQRYRARIARELEGPAPDLGAMAKLQELLNKNTVALVACRPPAEVDPAADPSNVEASAQLTAKVEKMADRARLGFEAALRAGEPCPTCGRGSMAAPTPAAAEYAFG